ncbi:MAG: biosynthetic-type acetolactate synthase large subunit [Anaerolineaceae bacterium]|nr:biosynthetic-type acetolactate synthase large subunit [Anaerolineaceae bacterium]
MKKTGAQIFWECLVKEGVDVVFGFPGGFNLPIYDAMPEYPVKHILVRHEQGGAHMAEGYARASGKVGVAMSTSGPGATNLVTGIANALMDSIPMVFITGQVNSFHIGYDAFQEIDVTGITMPITKHNYLITDVREINHAVREAFYLAKTGRPGPVLLDITKDAQVAVLDWEYDDTPIKLLGYDPTPTPAESDLEGAMKLIQQSKKPLILAGQGVMMSGAMDELKAFAEKEQIPIAVTLLGIGCIPAEHELHLGMMGMHGESWVNNAIQQADLLIACGMRFDDRVIGRVQSYAPHARKIHFELDQSEVNKNVQVDVAVIGDLKGTLQKVIPMVQPMKHDDWLESIDEMRTESKELTAAHTVRNGKLLVSDVMKTLSDSCSQPSIVVTDVGQHQMWAAQLFQRHDPFSFISSGGLGTMGYGLPAALGAKVACPEKSVWVIVGDGGFQMTQAELSTAAQWGIKVNVAIMNNGFLGMVRQWQELFYDHRYTATPILSPDFVKIGEAHGLPSRLVTSMDEVADVVAWAEKQPETVVIEFRVEPEENVYPMVSVGSALDEMILYPEEKKE